MDPELRATIKMYWLLASSEIYYWLMKFGGWLFKIDVTDSIWKELDRVEKKAKEIEKKLGVG